jgi:hypothetical protein
MPKVFVPFPRVALTYSIFDFPRVSVAAGYSFSNIIVIPSGGYFALAGLQFGSVTLECTFNTYGEQRYPDLHYTQYQLTPSIGAEWNNWFMTIGPTFVLGVDSNYTNRDDSPFPRNSYPFIHAAGLDWNIEIGYKYGRI